VITITIEISLLSVLILLAVAPSNSTPIFEAQSARPIAAFTTCFTQTQDRVGAAWAYLPAVQGGTFTGSGAHGATISYWLHVRAAGATTKTRLYSDARPDVLLPVKRAIAQCG
jgi:hypothetical protein